jgi:hypothetical protein
MLHSPVLFLHIVAGTLGMLSGFVAVFLRKGSRRHGLPEMYLSYPCCACLQPEYFWPS